MRRDGRPEGLRPSMAWLHTWSGLLLGWLLYAVFFTGTLSFFRDEIDTWMKPELHASVPGDLSPDRAVDGMRRLAPGAATWTLELPGARTTSIQASWRDRGAAPGRAGTRRAELDAATGEVIVPRATRGGDFLYRFHFELHALPRTGARWIVGIATMVMFVALLSGVITHKKIFADFFTFRPRKGPRSWLDAHNATAVLALPFHVVITFSGLLLLMNPLMPWGIDAVYKGDTQAYASERRGGVAPGTPAARVGDAGRDATRDDIGAAPLAALAPLLAQARARWPEHGVGGIVVQQPGTARATIELREGGGRSLLDRGAGERMRFDGTTGERLEGPAVASPSGALAVYNVLTAPHLGRFAGPGARWLLFVMGMIGTAMVATGLVMWVVKRLPERRRLGRTPHGHRLVEVLNVTAIAGLTVATASYFWSNRLIPADLPQRADWEIHGFFGMWGLCLAHAAFRRHRAAWREQLGLAALLFASLPVVDPLTGGAGLVRSIAQGQWSVAGFDLAMLGFAVIHGFVAVKLRTPETRPARKPLAAAVAASLATVPRDRARSP